MVDPVPRPGWYPDPSGGSGERWWNGLGWSDTRRGVATIAPTAPLPAHTPSPVAPTIEQQGVPVRIVYSAENPAPQAPGHTPSASMSSAVTVNTRVNPMAVYGLIAGIFALFFNFLLVPAVLAIVFSVRGLTTARKLESAGHTQTLKTIAAIGLILGIVGLVIGVVQFGALLFALAGSFVSGLG